jgi:pyridinium-3,5-bisthiocarboxylic acid mononucleotide nickel chelatase
VNFKVKSYKNEVLSIAPEFDECRKIAQEQDIPLKEVYRILEKEARTYLAQLPLDIPQ